MQGTVGFVSTSCFVECHRAYTFDLNTKTTAAPPQKTEFHELSCSWVLDIGSCGGVSARSGAPGHCLIARCQDQARRPELEGPLYSPRAGHPGREHSGFPRRSGCQLGAV